MIRVGLGYDLHRLVPERRLILAGVEIPFSKGLAGHSDADVVAHAVIDSLLGAAGLGDIGGHYPDTDSAYAGADSMRLLALTVAEVAGAGWRVENLDVTVIAEEPKIAPHVPALRNGLASTLHVPPEAVSIKGKTNEGLGPVGRGEAIATLAVVMLERYGVS